MSRLGLPVGATSIATALGVSSAAILALWRLPRRIGLAHMAVCAVAARFWSYHQHYDDAILVFLLLAAYETFLVRPSRGRLITGAAVALTLMVPARVSQFVAWQIAQQLTWIVAVSVIWKAARDLHPAAERAAG